MLLSKISRAVVLCFFVFQSVCLSAQVPKVKSIFWEITPKGGGKPSYLYGTMHVSKKVAFRLPNSFYEAIRNVDVVALESNPESWNSELEKSEDIRTLFDLTSIGLRSTMNYGKAYYSAMYGLAPLTNNHIKMELAYEPHSANELLFRSYGLQKNFEEDTYLDLYIFKTGKKFGKPIVSLEDVLWSMLTVVKASFATSTKKVKPYEGNLMKDMEDAYRDQDLAKLDSIQKASARSEAYLEGLLYIRNDTMFKHMDQLIKQGKTVFSAVGAAHLGGDRGLLQRFIKEGYQVKPIQDASQLEPSSNIVALDSVYLPVTFRAAASSDSTLTFVTPAHASRSNQMGKVEYLSTDMVNGVYYYIGRLNTFSLMSGLSAKTIEQKFDSLLFEHVKGNILEKRKAQWQGYPCLHIVNKTKDGNIHRQKIIITPLEILFCKVVGKENYFNKFPSDTFLNSIQIQYAKNPTRYALPDVSLNMPVSIIDNPFPSIAYNAPNLLAQGIDEQGDYYQFLRNYTVRQFEHEEDTFHVNMCAFFMLKDMKLKQKTQQNIQVKGLPAVDVLAKNEAGNKVYIRIIQRASSVYYLIVQTENESKAMRFLNSFEPIAEVSIKLQDYSDTTHHFTFRTHLKPLGGELNQAIFNQNNASSDNGKRKTVYTNVFGDYQLGYQFTFNIFELNKYECFPTIDSFWNTYYDEFLTRFTLEDVVEIKRKQWDAHNQHYLQLTITDTNTQNKSVYLAVTTDNKLLEMSSFYDTTQRSYRYIDTAFQSIRFSKPKPSVLVQSKLDTFLTHMLSKDSATKEYFNSNYNYSRTIMSDEKALIKILDTSDVLKKRDEVYSSLLYELQYFKNPSTLAFIKKLYKENEENSVRQVSLLNLLTYMNDTASTLLFKELILDSPPLEFEEDDDPMNHYFDTLSLARLLMPEILDLNDIDDYKYDIFYLTDELYKAGKIDSAMFASKVNYFTLKGKEEIRRKTSVKSSIEEAEAEEVEDNEDDKKSDKWSDIGTQFTLTNEKDAFQSSVNFGDFYLIRTFASLLKPYQFKPQVKEFFTKIDSSKNTDLRFDFALLRAKKKLPFDAGIIKEYAALPKYGYGILHTFYFNDLWSSLPISIANQQEVAKRKIMEKADLSLKDELQYVDKVWVQSNKEKGYIYIFKHKKEKDEDYLYDMTGLFNKDEKKLLPERGITLCNVDMEKKTLAELKDQLRNQFRVLNRIYVTPQQMLADKEDGRDDILQFMRNFQNGED